MKNIISYFPVLTATTLFAFSSARAADWTLYYDEPAVGSPAQSITVQWPTAVGSEREGGYWYTGSERTSETSMKGWLSDYENDNFTFGTPTGRETASGTVYDSILLYLDSDTTFGSLTFLGNGWDNSARIYARNHNITINSDLIKDQVSKNAFINNVNVLTVKNDIDIRGANFSVVGNQILVGGNLISTTGSSGIFLELNGLPESDSGGISMQNPNMIIGGYVDNVTINSKSINADSYYCIGGLTNNAAIRRMAPGSAASDDHISYFVLTNAQDYSTNGASSEVNNNVWTPTSGKMSIIMNGTASQSFTSTSMQFQGGLQIISGALKINFNQNGNSYNYKRDAAKLIDVTFVTQDGGSTRTAFSHGNLEMLGGAFSSTDSSSSYGAFRLANIIYSSGTISLRLESETQFDSLDLTSYYNRVADSTSGNEVITYERVNGGTISLSDGAAAGTKVTFEFSGDILGWLLDYEDGSFDINGGKGAKIVSWDAENKTALSASDFAGNWITQGDDYMPVFTVADDGLYVRYTVVPEPAEVAAILGALALAAAALHRRNRN